MPTRILLEHRDGSKGSFFLGRNIFGCLTVMAKATKQHGKEKKPRVFVPFPYSGSINAVLYHFFAFPVADTWVHNSRMTTRTFSSQEHNGLKSDLFSSSMHTMQNETMTEAKRGISCGLYEEHWLGQSHWVSNQHDHGPNRTNKESTRSGFSPPLLVSANRKVQFAYKKNRRCVWHLNL